MGVGDPGRRSEEGGVVAGNIYVFLYRKLHSLGDKSTVMGEEINSNRMSP
jgi:hypothetical protein